VVKSASTPVGKLSKNTPQSQKMKTIMKWGISFIVLASAIVQSAPAPERPITRDEIDKRIEAVEKRLAEKTDTLEKRG
jgi:hypothetical protein